MRVLLALLLVVIVGCGGGSSPPGGGAVVVKTPKNSQVKVEKGPADTPQAKVDKPPVQAADADPVSALKKRGAKIKQNERDKVVEVDDLSKITDTGLVHLKGMTNLQELFIDDTKITDASVAELKKALPNSYIGY